VRVRGRAVEEDQAPTSTSTTSGGVERSGRHRAAEDQRAMWRIQRLGCRRGRVREWGQAVEEDQAPVSTSPTADGVEHSGRHQDVEEAAAWRIQPC
jgi:hypothetical protein